MFFDGPKKFMSFDGPKNLMSFDGPSISCLLMDPSGPSKDMSTHFQGFANSQYFFLKIFGIGCVGLIDAKGIDVAQPIWS